MSHPLGTIVAYDKNVGYICRAYACFGYPRRLPLQTVDFKVEQSRSAVIDLSLSLSLNATHIHTLT